MNPVWFGFLFGLLASGAVAVVLGTVFKSRWGINLRWSGECPRCHNHRKIFRIPRNVRQFLWGGGTCNRCGLEVDKWNRPIAS
jgi:ABC-type uncharacterized transport system permease subunit